MTRWLVTFDDNVIVEAATAQAAVMQACDDPGEWFTLGATVYAVDLDAIAGTDRLFHFRVGLEEAEPLGEQS